MYLGGESNPYLKIRNFPFYPLNYQGFSDNFGDKITNLAPYVQIKKLSAGALMLPADMDICQNILFFNALSCQRRRL